jgi:putative transposase
MDGACASHLAFSASFLNPSTGAGLIRKFLGNNDNAIRLQLFAAMIADALPRIAARTHRVQIPILRFTDLVAQCLFDRRNIAAIDKPQPVNPSTRQNTTSADQLDFTYV